MKLQFKNSLMFAISSAVLFTSPLANIAYSQDVEEYFLTSNSTEITSSTVEVTAGKRVQDLMDVGYTVSIITQEEIENTAAVNFTDLLKNIPGIQVTRGASNAISIRGESTNRTLVLIDGVKVSFAGFSDENSDILIDPDSIERIEVIKGPASVLYGTTAFGGVINVITKKGGTKPIQGTLKTAYSSENDGVIVNGTVYGKVEDFSFRLNTSYTQQNGLKNYHTQEPDYRRNYEDIFIYGGYDFTDNINLGLTYEYYNENRTDPDEGDFYRYKNDSSKILATLLLTDMAEFLPILKADLHYYRYNSNNDAPASSFSVGGEEGKIDAYGINIQSDWRVGESLYVIAGYEFLYESLDNYQGNWGAATKKANAMSNSAYIHADLTLPYDFTLSAGVRYLSYHAQSDGFENIVIGRPLTSISFPAQNGTEDDFTFSVGLVWRGIDNLALRALYSGGFNPPSVKNKYLGSTHGFFDFLPNPALKSETSNNYELGARFDNGVFSADIAAFYTESENYITTDPDPAGSGDYTYLNTDSAKTWGFEWGFAYKNAFGFKGVEPYVNGTWMQRQITENGITSFDEDLPTIAFNAGLKYAYVFENGIKLNSDVYVRYESDVLTGDNSHGAGDGIGTDQVTTLNMSIGAEWGERAEYFTNLELLNILDTKYVYRGSSIDDEIYDTGFNANIVFGLRF